METKTLAVLLTLLSALSVLYTQVQPESTENKLSDFAMWKKKFGLTFKSEFEQLYREKIFLENLAKINSHNAN